MAGEAIEPTRQEYIKRQQEKGKPADNGHFTTEFYQTYKKDFEIKGGAPIDIEGRIIIDIKTALRKHTNTHSIDLEPLNELVESVYGGWLHKVAEQYAFERKNGFVPECAYNTAMEPLTRLIMAINEDKLETNPLFHRLLEYVRSR